MGVRLSTETVGATRLDMISFVRGSAETTNGWFNQGWYLYQLGEWVCHQDVLRGRRTAWNKSLFQLQPDI